MAIILTDENFDKEVSGTKKLVLVDFFATWCDPCTMLAPILEKIEKDLGDKIVLMKANVDEAPAASQKFRVSSIPMVVLLKDGKLISSFVGLRPEEAIKEWIKKYMEENFDEMIQEYEVYAEKNNLKLNPDRKVLERIMKGLLANEAKHGEKYCPCRRVVGNKEEDSKKICPCSWHKDEVEKDGHCFCNLFVK